MLASLLHRLRPRSSMTRRPGHHEHIRRVLVILGHPRSRSLCGRLAEAWKEGAEAQGMQVELVRLGELSFEPSVLQRSPADQPLEPDLVRLTRLIERSDHLVWVFPVWWASFPALLKALFDRLLVPGWAFRRTRCGLSGYEGLLRGRSSEIVTTMDTPSRAHLLLYGRAGERALRQGILRFCGLVPIRVYRIDRVVDRTEEDLQKEVEAVRERGRSSLGWILGAEKRRRRLAWLRIARLQFYAMTLLAYGLGAAAAPAVTGAPFSVLVFGCGFLGLFLLELMGVLTNEYYDLETDRRNRLAGPFNGGSRVLVEAGLTPVEVRAVVGPVFLAAVTLLFPLLLFVLVDAVWFAAAFLWLTLGFVLAPQYTAPPLRLVYRGWGEAVVAFSHSIFMIMTGWLLQGGGIDHALPWLLSLPLFLAVFCAITLAGIPDRRADASVGKRTLAVRMGSERAIGAALLGATLAALATWLPLPDPFGDLFAGGRWFMIVHLLALLAAGLRHLRQGTPERRVDGLLVLALTYIFWFSLGPLLALAQ
jgi:1,4-dihydroxy-2-naphthoate polyprenyltransferase